jgi:hypothetical protein
VPSDPKVLYSVFLLSPQPFNQHENSNKDQIYIGFNMHLGLLKERPAENAGNIMKCIGDTGRPEKYPCQSGQGKSNRNGKRLSP